MRMDEDVATDARTIAFVTRHAPHGSVFAQEALEVVLLGAAFEQRVRLVFMDDGIFQIKKGQDTEALGVKNFARAFNALPMYELDRIVVERESLQARGLDTDDLAIEVEVLNAADIARMLDDSDVLLGF
ncbi:MAG: tRNA 2-thiouridine synthesizing protein C [Gammaproteobacteria bacterium]|jgi:tRNA 2-thiouridine synthesizing protein C